MRLADGASSASRRWSAGTTRDAGPLAPDDFIPLAEETGADRAARPLGARARRAAQPRAWQRARPTARLVDEREPVRPPAPATRRSSTRCARVLDDDRPRPRLPHARDHRERAHAATPTRRSRALREPQGPRRAARHRRLRHRLLVARATCAGSRSTSLKIDRVLRRRASTTGRPSRRSSARSSRLGETLRLETVAEGIERGRAARRAARPRLRLRAGLSLRPPPRRRRAHRPGPRRRAVRRLRRRFRRAQAGGAPHRLTTARRDEGRRSGSGVSLRIGIVARRTTDGNPGLSHDRPPSRLGGETRKEAQPCGSLLRARTAPSASRLVPMLVASGHRVTGTTTSDRGDQAIRAMGAEPVVIDGLDAAGDRRGGGPSRAGCDHPRDDGALGHARLPPLRSLVRADEPASDGGHGASPRRRQGERRQAVRGPELHRLEQRPDRFVDQDRGGSARSAPGQRADRDARRDPVPRAGGPRGAARGDRRPLRRAVRPGLIGDPRRDPPQADVPGRSATAPGSSRRPHVDDAAAGRSPRSSAAGAASTTSSTTTRRPSREYIPALAEVLGAPKPPPHPGLARSAPRRRRRGRDDDGGPRLVEREGEAGAGLAADLAELARRVPPRPRHAGAVIPARGRGRRRRTGSRRPRDPRPSPGRRRRGLCRPPPAAVLDRLSDARERQRGGGRRPGGVHPLPARDRRRHRRRVAEGLPVGRRHPAGDRPAQVGAGPARDIRRRVAAGAARDGRRGRGSGGAAPSRPTRSRCRSSSCSSG